MVAEKLYVILVVIKDILTYAVVDDVITYSEVRLNNVSNTVL